MLDIVIWVILGAMVVIAILILVVLNRISSANQAAGKEVRDELRTG